MTGAIVPDDWDGVSFNCQQVIWPSSVRWRAILLGQLTEAEKESFWDGDFPGLADAIQAVKDAETLTLPGFWTEECEEVQLAKAFWAYPTSTQTLAVTTWETLQLDTLEYSINDPNFSLALNAHVPVNEDLLGLWHYDISVYIASVGRHLMRAIKQPGNVDLALASETGSRTISLSFDAVHLVASNQVRVEVWSSDGGNIEAREDYTHFGGHFVGPTE